MKKRLFQILDELNVQDGDKTSDHAVMVGNQIVSMDYSAKHGGTKVTVGIAGNQVFDLQNGNKMALLLIIDKKQYNEAKNKEQ